MTFKDYHKESREKLDQAIKNYLDTRAHEVEVEMAHTAMQRIAEFSTRGKMLRGIFAMFAYEMYTGKVDNNAIQLAIFMELTQSALLIHDDIMDRDELRRGEKSMHALYADDARAQTIERPEEYGNAIGTIAGDIGFFLVIDLMSKIDTDPGVLNRMMERYSHEITKTGLGQFLDYHYASTDISYSLKEINDMYHYKTGTYTFTLPFVLGAILAKAPDAEMKVLEDITRKLGTVFQLVDDMIGMFGDPKKTGKPVGADIKEGKKTVLRAMLYEHVNDEEKAKLDGMFGVSCTDEDLAYVRELCDRYKISEQIHTEVKKLSEEAQEELKELSISENHRAIFSQLIDYNASRIV